MKLNPTAKLTPKGLRGPASQHAAKISQTAMTVALKHAAKCRG